MSSNVSNNILPQVEDQVVGQEVVASNNVRVGDELQVAEVSVVSEALDWRTYLMDFPCDDAIPEYRYEDLPPVYEPMADWDALLEGIPEQELHHVSDSPPSYSPAYPAYDPSSFQDYATGQHQGAMPFEGFCLPASPVKIMQDYLEGGNIIMNSAPAKCSMEALLPVDTIDPSVLKSDQELVPYVATYDSHDLNDIASRCFVQRRGTCHRP